MENMLSNDKKHPVFEKGSPSSEFLQIGNFCVNYLDGLLLMLIHNSLENSSHKLLIERERTVRHTFQFQIEKSFLSFKSTHKARLQNSANSDWFLLELDGKSSAKIQNEIKKISAKFQQQYNKNISNLNKRLKHLIYRSDNSESDNPLSPNILIKAFLASIETLNFTIKDSLALLSEFDELLSKQLGIFYDQVDLGLYYLDVLPELTDPVLYNPVALKKELVEPKAKSKPEKKVSAKVNKNKKEAANRKKLELISELKQQQIKLDKTNRQVILETINSITSGLSVEIDTLHFFYDDWQVLLYHLYRKTGFNSDAFNQAVNIAGMLAYSLSDTATTATEFPPFSYKSLLKSIEKGLVALNYSDEHRHRVRQQLIKEYKKVKRSTKRKLQSKHHFDPLATLNHFPKLVSQNTLRIEKRLGNNSQNTEMKTIEEIVSRLNIGGWIEVRVNDSSKYTRAKLLSIKANRKANDPLYTFANQRGHIVMKEGYIDLCQKFSKGLVKSLGSSSPNTVASSLKRLSFINPLDS